MTDPAQSDDLQQPEGQRSPNPDEQSLISEVLPSKLIAVGKDLESLDLSALQPPDKDLLREFLADARSLNEQIPVVLEILNRRHGKQQQHDFGFEITSTPDLTAIPTRQAVPIAREDILVVTKLSKVQYDMHKHNLSLGELVDRYNHGGEDTRRILTSHYEQKANRDLLRQHIPVENFITRNDISKEVVSGYKAVIALGGDNHFQYVSHFINDDTPVFGVNADPVNSTGALLPNLPSDIAQFLTRLEAADYEFKPVTRLEAKINGDTLAPAMCDIFLGRMERSFMSRHVLHVGDLAVEQKSSGLLVVTGAGSGAGSWFDAASRYIFPDGNKFDLSAPYVRFMLTEASSAKGEIPVAATGILARGETLEIESLNRENGIAVSDSLEQVDFSAGKRITIRIADDPLWMVDFGS